MNRRGFLRGVVAGLLGCAAPHALLPEFATGGLVSRTGLAVIHGPESILPRAVAEDWMRTRARAATAFVTARHLVVVTKLSIDRLREVSRAR